MIRRVALLVAAATAAVLLGGPPATAAAPLEEVTGFGSNPGNLRMFRHVPAGLAPGRPLVVALHGCTQSAAAYDDEPGWVALADRLGFALLLPQQQSVNNGSSCFNWFETADTTRGSGEALSIKQMVDRMLADQGGDAARVFATGLSAGGAMTAVLMAAYPDVFAGGAVVAGLPYRCATTVAQAFGCMSPGVDLTPRQWGDKVRAASGHTGPWPTLSVWHGSSDSTVAPGNMTELAEQWTDVHGADQVPEVSDTVNDYPHRGYRDAAGRTIVDTYSITGMGHGHPVDPGSGPAQCGTAAPYVLDVGVCAAHHIAVTWGLDTAPPPVGGTSVFTGVESQDGYVKANADGTAAAVGTLANLAIGRGTDGKQNRSVLSFDTSGLPDGAAITRAYLTVTYSSGAGDPWTGNRLLVDARTGCFGSCATEASDWAAPATAAVVAEVPRFTSGSRASTDLTAAGLAAIDVAGTTQLRLRYAVDPASTAYLFVRSGAATTLTVEHA